MLYYYEYLDIANAVDRGKVRSRNLSTRTRNSAFDLTDREFIKTYRLSKDLATSLIDQISVHMPVSLRSDGIDTETKILVALAFYAGGSYQTLVGQSSSHSISQPSVSRAIRQVTEVINLPNIFNKYVKFPSTQEARDEIKREFYQKFGMAGVLGCIDGTHVAIVPPAEHEERYFNRKGYHSLNILIICDSNAGIMCVDSSNPGSTHDSAAWNNNPLNDKLNEIVRSGEDFYLLGDSGFPLRRIMMTPILNTTEPNSPESYYTDIHASTRNVVERCIGILKARFRCLHIDRRLHYKPQAAARIVNACCVLHNIALQCTEHVESEEDQNTSQEEAIEGQANASVEDYNISTRAGRQRSQTNVELQQGRDYQRSLVQRLWQSRS